MFMLISLCCFNWGQNFNTTTEMSGARVDWEVCLFTSSHIMLFSTSCETCLIYKGLLIFTALYLCLSLLPAASSLSQCFRAGRGVSKLVKWKWLTWIVWCRVQIICLIHGIKNSSVYDWMKMINFSCNPFKQLTEILLTINAMLK